MSSSQRAFLGGVVAVSLIGVCAFQLGAGRTGRVADAPHFAVVDVLAVSEKLFLSERYAPAREGRIKEKQDQINAMQSSIEELVGNIQKAGQTSPEGKAMIESYQAKNTELNTLRQKATEELSAFSTEQFGECYKTVVETANSMARKSGYTHVLASRVGPLEFRSKELPAALQEVLARPALMYGDGDDMTPAVFKELKLDPTPDKKPEAPKEEPKADQKK